MSPRKCCLLLLVCLVSALGFSQSNFDHRQFAGPVNATLRSQVDLNKDGIPDLLLGLNGGIVVVLSNGNGAWQTPRQYAVGASSSTAEFVVEDFNRDGNPDVIFTNRENAYLLLGNGDGTLRPPTVIPNTQNATRLETADFNRDGKLDLVVGTDFVPQGAGDTLTVNLMLGNGDGTFGAPKQLYHATHEFDISNGFFIANVLAGDFDADGKADLLIDIGFAGHGGASSMYNFYYGDGAGGFSQTAPVSQFGWHQSNVIDLNRDGRADVVSSEQQGDFGVRILYGQTNRTFTEVHLAVGCGGYPQVADYNGDGINDIATLGCDSTGSDVGVQIIYGQPDGTFANPQFITITTGSSPSNGLSYVLAGDYNRDRKPDLITLQPSNGVLHEEINTSSGPKFPKCVTLAKPYGINSCGPASGSTVASPVNFSASALSLSPVRKMEVWVDGAKKVEKFNSYAVYSYLDQSVA
ncbi:MAG: repeat-associated core domain protein, partial [Candidatus Angelobacter sp.]|nr:repeat-associated core domain protein [Candidatus Angelobacter sp.]